MIDQASTNAQDLVSKVLEMDATDQTDNYSNFLYG